MDGNGLMIWIIGGDANNPAQVFLQLADGSFKQRHLMATCGTDAHKPVQCDAGLLLFDANGDGKLDLYVESGGYKMHRIAPYTRTGFI